MNEQKFCPDTNLAWALFATIVGGSLIIPLAFGVMAISKSLSVERLWREGRIEAAQSASDDAKKYAIIGLIITAVGGTILAVWAVCLIAGVTGAAAIAA